ncbi:MAG: hypothetical protein IPM23_15605 [Candidatus Melainabacteria bacterium]|nr:hypothetical protein [Candidatus Melainabacteria bacterium]
MTGAAQDASGKWRGFYTYRHNPDAGCAFDAHLEVEEGVLSGRIHDDYELGEATVSGAYHFPSINFTKVYVSGEHAPIHYVGTMSEDGRSMSGTWLITHGQIRWSGTWRAHRSQENDSRARTTSKQKKRQKIKDKQL